MRMDSNKVYLSQSESNGLPITTSVYSLFYASCTPIRDNIITIIFNSYVKKEPSFFLRRSSLAAGGRGEKEEEDGEQKQKEEKNFLHT